MPRPLWASERVAGMLRLIAAVAAIALLWLGLLPLVARQPDIRAFIEHNEAHGIDPSAKFYTELPGMPEFADRVECARRRHAAAFWP